jgi:putative membrane protein
MTEHRPRPRAFRLDDQRVALDDAPAPVAPTAVIRSETTPIPATTRAEPLDETERQIEAAQNSGLRSRWRPTLGAVTAAAFGGLVSLTLGLWASDLIEGLFARAASLGWLGAAFALLFVIGLLGLAGREVAAMMRQSRIAELHAALDVAERALLRPLDAKAQAEIAAAAKRVSVVTAISPRAVFDLIFVVAQVIRLVRRIAEIYGGRPGLFGFFRLARSIATHLAITGGMAVGDSLLQQIVGHGIASKISARMGEGVLNGLLTARVGLSALAVCRPAPFSVEKPPGLSDVAPFLFGGGKDA